MRGGNRMKPGQMIAENGFDGFDRNVAEKMPKIRKEEEPSLSHPEEKTESLGEVSQELKLPEKHAERKAIFTPPKEGEGEEDLEVLKLIEDLHAQLLVSNRTKRALEIDLASSQKTIQQLAHENQALGIQAEGLRKELQRLQDFQSEIVYLEEENEDASERIRDVTRRDEGLERDLSQNRSGKRPSLGPNPDAGGQDRAE
jgi:hypothetical protein